MSKRKTKYSVQWETSFKWLKKHEKDQFSAYCKLCEKEFYISGSGICLVKQHANTKGHINKVGEQRNQCTFSKDSDNVVCFKKGVFIHTQEDKRLNAEVLHALKCVDANWSFSSANHEGKRFSLMFPDSEIAKNYKLGETKLKYTIQYGIAPHFKELLKNDLKNKPFSFKFDETTNQQIKKQFDGYVQYWSTRHECFKVSYCGTLFVDHCPAEKFIQKIDLDLRFMIHIGMDGPNMNLKFEDLLRTSATFAQLDTTILSIGTCPLHITHNAFRAGVSKLYFNIDAFAIDISFFFKLSAACRADYIKIEQLTDVVSRFVNKHSSTRWVTLKKICVQLLEQFENLKSYFLDFLPKTDTFKRTVKETDRYKRIVKVLKDDVTIPYLSFITFIANDFEQFLMQFQSTRPMIHVLHSEMVRFVRTLMMKFVKSRLLVDYTNNGQKIPKSTNDLLLINVKDPKNCKPIRMVDVSTKANNSFPESLDMSPIETKFRKDCLECYQVAVNHLITKLPLKSSVLENCQYLDPRKRNETGALNAVMNLTKSLCKPLKGILNKAFSGNYRTYEEVSDGIRNEWREYQMETVPGDYFLKEEIFCEGRKQKSYWEKAFELAGIESKHEGSCILDLDSLIISMKNKLISGSNCPKYTLLLSLFKAVGALSHGNSAPENGFSINKFMINVHGNSIEGDTIESLRMVKDGILSFGSIFDVPITRSLLDSVRQSYQRYNMDLEAKRKIREAEEAAQRKDLEEKKVDEALKEETNCIRSAIRQIENGLVVADDIAAEGNEELKKCLLQNSSTRKDLQRAQSKIETGMKRRQELVEQHKVLAKRMKEIS